MNRLAIAAWLLLAAGLAAVVFYSNSSPKVQAVEQASPSVADELAILKGKSADQAHAMVSVAYHFNNLWFAGKAKNWPLSQFYLNETKSHMRWSVRIIPVRKDNAGKEIRLNDILQAVENTLVKELQESVDAKDEERFETAYKTMLSNGCYSCQKAADKPYLRPQIPEQPAESMINFDPNAKWPQ